MSWLALLFLVMAICAGILGRILHKASAPSAVNGEWAEPSAVNSEWAALYYALDARLCDRFERARPGSAPALSLFEQNMFANTAERPHPTLWLSVTAPSVPQKQQSLN